MQVSKQPVADAHDPRLRVYESFPVECNTDEIQRQSQIPAKLDLHINAQDCCTTEMQCIDRPDSCGENSLQAFQRASLGLQLAAPVASGQSCRIFWTRHRLVVLIEQLTTTGYWEC